MITGTILSGVGGFYDVKLDSNERLTCQLRGKLRLGTEGVMVGDRVGVLMDEEAGKGYVECVLERRSRLPRPAVANIDQTAAIMSLKAPKPNLMLLDRILVLAEYHRLAPFVVLNKSDLADADETSLRTLRHHCAPYNVYIVSAESGYGLETLLDRLSGKITALAGPSGVGKSTLINQLVPDHVQAVGDISRKLGRGRHTTRQVTLLPLPAGGFVADTPGFSQLALTAIPREELADCFPEISAASAHCPYRGCTHTKEQQCAVKEAVENGDVASTRYQSYIAFWNEYGTRRGR